MWLPALTRSGFFRREKLKLDIGAEVIEVFDEAFLRIS